MVWKVTNLSRTPISYLHFVQTLQVMTYSKSKHVTPTPICTVEFTNYIAIHVTSLIEVKMAIVRDKDI
jgi:hypothetical protein